jgi:hypothetical protein
MNFQTIQNYYMVKINKIAKKSRNSNIHCGIDHIVVVGDELFYSTHII